MELENYYYKNLKKLFLSKFRTQDLVNDIPFSFISFWLFFKNIKKNNVLGFIIALLIADGKFPFLLKKTVRSQSYFLGVKVSLHFSFLNFIQKFIFLYLTGLEDVTFLKLKPKGSQYLIILKKNFPYASEIDIFLESVMRNFTTNIFNIIITLHGLSS